MNENYDTKYHINPLESHEQVASPNGSITSQMSIFLENYFANIVANVGLGGLGVTCSPRDPRFAGSNLTEVDGYFSGHKIPEHKSSGRYWGSRVLRFQAR